jgi:uncharacterized protein
MSVFVFLQYLSYPISMSDSKSVTDLSILIQICKIDSNLAHIAAEEKKERAEIEKRQATLKKVETELKSGQALLKEKKLSCQREEKALRDEQAKLSDRRRVLASFPSYKLQQAAEKEIDNTARELSDREEQLLGLLDQTEAIEKKVAEIEKFATEETTELEVAIREFNELKTGYDERRKRQHEERAILVVQVNPTNMKLYDRVHEKYVVDPVIALNGSSCSGCHMQVGPQVFVIIRKGEALVRCPGCGRIVYLPE